MSVVQIGSANVSTLEAEEVTVEVDVSSGLYSFSIVGLPSKSTDESKDRVVAALKNSGLRSPKQENHKVVVSLVPADIKKEGSHFDVAIALGYLLASKQLRSKITSSWFIGELSLTGEVQPAKGVLLIAEKAKALGVQNLFVPYVNREEAALVAGINVYGCKTLQEIVCHFGGLTELTGGVEKCIEKSPLTEITYTRPQSFLDIQDIKGQETAKRALMIAATGEHNIALYGPPGTGKTMLARAFASILPPLSQEQIFEVTRIHSFTNPHQTIISHPPFRSPHHTASYVSIVGGGSNPKPGEATLAHRGVLFLDEFPEFDKRVIESLREPLEGGVISVSRAKGTFHFPASCILVAAMNPCPCGYMGSNVKRCICTRGDIDKYARKLSGPIVDRIDVWVPVQHVGYDTLSHSAHQETGEDTAKRVAQARAFGQARNKNLSSGAQLLSNKNIPTKDFEKFIALTPQAETLMKNLATKYTLSPRSYHRVLRVARTIADLEESTDVKEEHVLESFQYRPKLYREM